MTGGGGGGGRDRRGFSLREVVVFEYSFGLEGGGVGVASLGRRSKKSLRKLSVILQVAAKVVQSLKSGLEMAVREGPPSNLLNKRLARSGYGL